MTNFIRKFVMSQKDVYYVSEGVFIKNQSLALSL